MSFISFISSIHKRPFDAGVKYDQFAMISVFEHSADAGTGNLTPRMDDFRLRGHITLRCSPKNYLGRQGKCEEFSSCYQKIGKIR